MHADAVTQNAGESRSSGAVQAEEDEGNNTKVDDRSREQMRMVASFNQTRTLEVPLIFHSVVSN